MDQIKAARPSRDYDPGYVTPQSFVKADQFVEAITKGWWRDDETRPDRAGVRGRHAGDDDGAGARRARPPRSPKEAAPVDLTGYWVSLVTEDWRWRMVTPIKGDSASVPINPAAKQIMNNWDPAKDKAAGNQCKGYGAPAIMRRPGGCISPGRTTTRSRSRPTPVRRRACFVLAVAGCTRDSP